MYAKLNKFLERMVTEAVQETAGYMLPGEDDEQVKQDALSQVIDDEKLRAPKKKKKDKEKSKSDDGEDVEKEAADDEEGGDEDDEAPKKRKSPVGAGKDYKVPVDTPTPEQYFQAPFDEFIEKLKSFRSGRGVGRDEIEDNLRAYYSGLSQGERQSMLAFITSLAKIMAAGQEPEDAVTPAQIGVKVRPRKSPPTEKTKKVEPDERPIVVGEHADKSWIRTRLREINRK